MTFVNIKRLEKFRRWCETGFLSDISRELFEEVLLLNQELSILQIRNEMLEDEIVVYAKEKKALL